MMKKKVAISIVAVCFLASPFVFVGFVGKASRVTSDLSLLGSTAMTDDGNNTRRLSGTLQGTVEYKAKTIKRNDAADGVCFTVCDARRKIVEQHYRGGDLRNVSHVRHIVEQASEELVGSLKDQYGADQFDAIFKLPAEAIGRWTYRGFDTANRDTGPSMERMERKLLLKILKAQLNYDSKLFSIVDGCDCTNGHAKAVGSVPSTAEDATEYLQRPPAGLDDDSRFVWATGGHSASAGHGNLYNESYTAFLEKSVSPLFESLGIRLIGRNYAMGGTSSGPEIGLCTRSIFGEDIDALSWDYGMTDGRFFHKIFFYGYRAALHPSRPAIFGIHITGKQGRQRLEMFQKLEDMGVSAFAAVEDQWDAMINAIPDTQGMTDDQIAAMPPMVRNFKCFGKIETGAPYCGAQKFNLALCPSRKARTSWHPGVKQQALDGNRMALMLMQLLQKAVSNPRFLQAKDPKMLVAELQAEDDEEHRSFRKSDIPNEIMSQSEISEPIREILFRRPNICHTGRLPAQIRYKGVLSGRKYAVITGPGLPGKEEYMPGMPKDDAIQAAAKDSESTANSDAFKPMRLAYEPSEREWSCPALVKADYKDFFLAPYADGWTHITLPNNAERAEYAYNPDMVHGIVIICPVICDWGRCPQGDVSYMNLMEQTERPASFRVNGVDVTGWDRVGGCYALKNDEDGLFHKKNTDGVFDISMKANQPGTYLRVSSFIVY